MLLCISACIEILGNNYHHTTSHYNERRRTIGKKYIEGVIRGKNKSSTISSKNLQI